MPAAPQATPPPLIEVERLVKRFGKVAAVDGIDLSIPPAGVFALLGPNGAGKTTVIRILSTILRPDSGRVEMFGIDLAGNGQAIRERIGLAGQYAATDENLTGRENLQFIGRLTHLSRAQAKLRAGEILERFALTHAADRPVRTYSGGMRRRLDLGAALVHMPPLLFLDEPTTGLDPHSRAELWRVIKQLVDDGTTVLLTTQYLEEADRLADRVAVIDRGRKIAEGTSAELKSTLGATIIEVDFASSDAAARAADLLGALGVLEFDVGAREVRLQVTEGSRVAMEVARRLDAAGLEPIGFGIREPSLDDVFLSLTGASSEEAGFGAPATGDPEERGR